MDSYRKCLLASEKAAWSFQEALGDLSFDHDNSFLPRALCGKQLPAWLAQDEVRLLNQIRGYSYAHLFEFIEQFIVFQACETASGYVHQDSDAVGAVLNFANEESKHQRMFVLVKTLLEEGFGFRPAALPDKEGFARQICQRSAFAVYLMTLMLEWLTQRHYIECFNRDQARVDPGFVRVFRLHWTEEAQHARIDTLELEALATTMTEGEIRDSVDEFVDMLRTLSDVVQTQDQMDLETFESAIGRSMPASKREELLRAMHREYLWAFIVSGLEHRAFQRTYTELVPVGAPTVYDLSEDFGSRLSEMELADHAAAAAATKPPAGSGEPEQPAHETASAGCILVIDDQEHIRDFARYALELRGFRVLTATNGPEAVELFTEQSSEISAILLDLTMPGMSGDKVLENLRAVDPHVKTIISSGHMRDDVVKVVPEGTFSAYLQKPYVIDHLQKVVETVLVS